MLPFIDGVIKVWSFLFALLVPRFNLFNRRLFKPFFDLFFVLLFLNTGYPNTSFISFEEE